MNMDKIIELIAIAEASGNFEKSFRLHMEAAERGNVVAMSEIGSMYMKGTGVTKNDIEGFKWILRAAEHNYPTAMAMVARMYELGIGTEQNIHEALKWYVDAANAGEEHAKNRLEELFNERS